MRGRGVRERESGKVDWGVSSVKGTSTTISVIAIVIVIIIPRLLKPRSTLIPLSPFCSITPS